MVLQFFESQASDPKPSRFGRMRHFDNVESSELGSDSNEEFEDSDGDLHDANLNNYNNSNNNNNKNSINSISIHNKTDCLSKNELADDDDDGDEEDDEDDYEEFRNYYDHLENNSSKRIKQINSNSFNFTRSKKRVNKEAGLWWDEDIALNELTSSMSFDFDNQYHLQSPIGNNNLIHANIFSSKTTENEEQVTLRTLESILSKDLLRNNESNSNSKENIISSSSSSIISADKTAEPTLVRRLSLS